MPVNLKQLKEIGDTSDIIGKWTSRAINAVHTLNAINNTGDISKLHQLDYWIWLAGFRLESTAPLVTFATATDAQIKAVCFNNSVLATPDAVDTVKGIFQKVEVHFNNVKADAENLPANDL